MEVYNVTLNPNDSGPNNALSNGNLTLVNTASNTSIRATHGRSLSNKWYFEVKFDAGSPSFLVGIANKSLPLTTNVITNSNQRGVYAANGNKYPEVVAYGASLVIGDMLGVLVDLDNGTLEFRKNNISMGGISHTDIKILGEIYPFFMGGATTSKTVTFNFGATPFMYEVPKGFYSYDGRQYGSSAKFLISVEDGKGISISGGGYTENLIPKMTGLTTPSGIVTASSATTGSNSAWTAFDKSLANADRWVASGTSGWIAYEFPEPVRVDMYSIQSTTQAGSSYTAQEAKDWTFEGSNDSVNWNVLDTRSNVTDWTAGGMKDFAFNNSVAYKKYRLNITANNGSTFISVAELLMYSSIPKVMKTMGKEESSFLLYGMEKDNSIDMYSKVDAISFVNKSIESLGSGKLFKHPIDRSKHPANKIVLG